MKSAGPGPGSDKIVVTNDGATILKSIHIDNPAAKILVGKREFFLIFMKKIFLKLKMTKLETEQPQLLSSPVNF